MNSNFINIVLYCPEIPQNTGNIARLCVANDLKLHLIEPLGFEINDKQLKRSALDYWQYLDYQLYNNWDDFCSLNQGRFWYLTTKVDKPYWDIEFQTTDYLIFGSETRGIPEMILGFNLDHCLTVPMSSDNSRSLNLASTVQTVYYEAYRQLA